MSKNKAMVGVEKNFTDRERILINIAALLASELAHLQSRPDVQRYMASPHSLSRIFCEWDLFNKKPFRKGELVVCQSSTGRQQNPWLVSFVEQQGFANEPRGLVLRAIGSRDLCNYGNESFIRINGIAERLLWEGEKHAFSRKLHKALRVLDNYGHRFRGLEFPEDGVATVYIGQVFGGLGKPTKPYSVSIAFNKRTSVKGIISQLKAQGFGTREFELDDGTYSGPMEGFATFTRESLIQTLQAEGVELKPEVTAPR